MGLYPCNPTRIGQDQPNLALARGKRRGNRGERKEGAHKMNLREGKKKARNEQKGKEFQIKSHDSNLSN